MYSIEIANLYFSSRPYLWGKVTVEQHSVRKDLGTSLSREPSLEQVLDALEPQRLHNSALLFPVTRRLIGSDIKAVDTAVEGCYDPCFLLPLFSNLTAPGMSTFCTEQPNFIHNVSICSPNNDTCGEPISYMIGCTQPLPGSHICQTRISMPLLKNVAE